MCCTFWLQNVLFATTACIFSTSELQKVLQTPHVLCIFTSKCAFRHNGVHSFDIRNFKTCSETDMFGTFSLQNVLFATTACIFSTSELQKVLLTVSSLAFSLPNLRFATAACIFLMSPLSTYLRTRRFNRPTFRLTRHTNHWKTQHFATSLTFGADVSSFFWLSHYCIFFLLTWLLYSAFQLSILSEVSI